MKKKTHASQNNKILILTSFLFVAGIVAVPFLSQKQEVRSHAAESGIKYISSAGSRTGKGSATGITMLAPKGSQAGDLLVAILQADYGHIGGTLPEGWKLINERNENDDLTQHAYYKIATAQEPANYTWKIIDTAEHKGLAGGTIMVFRGVNQTNPVSASVINPETKDPRQIACPSVNTPAGGGMLVCGYTHDDPVDIKPPAGMTRLSDFIIRDNDAHAVAYQKITKAGQTGERIATTNWNNNGKGSNDISIAIMLQSGDAQAQPSPSVTPGVPSPACLGCSPSEPPASISATVTPTPSTSGSGNFLIEFLQLLLELFKRLGNVT